MRPRLSALVLSMLLLTGCGVTTDLRGRVVDSEVPSIEFVSIQDGDPELITGTGIPGARIELVRDPRSLRRETVAVGSSGADGVFRIPIDAFGAGWMEETWLIRCTHPAHPMVEHFCDLPGAGSDRVLRVGLGAPGRGGREMDESERIRRELERYGG